MNKRHQALAAVFVLAAALLFFGDKPPETEVVESHASQPNEPQDEPNDAPQKRRIIAVADKAIMGDKVMGLRQRMLPLPWASLQAPEFEVPILFAARNWNPPPPKVVDAPPPPPTAPPMPFVYVGKKLEAGMWEIFLSNGTDIRVARKNSVIDGVYRVSDISPPTLTLTYLPLNQVQQLNIGTLD
jgi:hypothetical protein